MIVFSTRSDIHVYLYAQAVILLECAHLSTRALSIVMYYIILYRIELFQFQRRKEMLRVHSISFAIIFFKIRIIIIYVKLTACDLFIRFVS